MAFDPSEARDEKGRWTEGGGAAGGPDTRTHDVGGDKWNQDTAVRLENEYEAVRGTLDNMAHHAEDNSEEVTVAAAPQTWDDLSGGQQESTEQKYLENNYDQELSYQVDNWHENGESYVEAAQQLAGNDDWKHEALKEFIEQREENGDPRVPFKPEDLADSIKITAPDYGEGYSEKSKQPDIEFDDSKLQSPDNGYDPKQQTLPGVEPIKPEDSLTKEMRDAITAHLAEKFVEDADSKKSDMEPPEYLGDSAKESLEESWSEMGDDEKYELAKKYFDLDSSEDEVPQTVTMPNKWDPLNDTSGADYRATQSMARYLQTQRGADLLKERGIQRIGQKSSSEDNLVTRKFTAGVLAGKWGVSKDGLKIDTGYGLFDTEKEAHAAAIKVTAPVDKDDKVTAPVDKDDIANANRRMWESWKDSSTGSDGMMVQAAAHEELGGRLNQHRDGINVKDAKEYADISYARVGGYDGVKALIRATWETSQYMLDKANMPMLDLYRGIDKEDLREKDGKWYKVDVDRATAPEDRKPDKLLRSETVHTEDTGSRVGGDFTRLPDMHVGRNGAASWTTDVAVANKWKGGAFGKTTLRAEVPRTAVLSVPAYGVNMYSEHEVVVIGTAWKAWDAFAGRAPRIDSVPLAHVAKATPVIKQSKAHSDSTYKEPTT